MFYMCTNSNESSKNRKIAYFDFSEEFDRFLILRRILDETFESI